MIKNEQQYRVTKTQIERLEAERAAIERVKGTLDPLMYKLQLDSHDSLIGELRGEMEEYVKLKSGKRTRIECRSLTELPQALICARIARGLTHKALGELLGLKEQQIQQYEATEYEAASFTRIVEVATVLCVDVSAVVTLGKMRQIPTTEELDELTTQNV